ncbi:MAG: hypothetical protein R2788_11275 [Saprospiraceae bacterium]
MANQIQPASFKRTQILYYGLFIGQALMGLVMFYAMETDLKKEVVPPFNFVIPGAVLFGLMASYFIGQMRNNGIPTNGTIQEKLTHYQSTSILKFALMEGGNLISLVLTFMMANTNYLMWFGLGLAAFFLLRPNKDSFMEQYQVKMGEEFE